MSNLKHVYDAVVAQQSPKDTRSDFFRSGDSAETVSAIGDYSGGLVRFSVQPSPGEAYDIRRIGVLVEASGQGISADAYGNGPALLNGIRLVKEQSDNTELVDFTPLPITTNVHWARYCYDADVKTWGVGNQFLIARWTFARDGTLIRLEGEQKLSVLLNDDFSSQVDHTFRVGYVKR